MPIQCLILTHVSILLFEINYRYKYNNLNRIDVLPVSLE